MNSQSVVHWINSLVLEVNTTKYVDLLFNITRHLHVAFYVCNNKRWSSESKSGRKFSSDHFIPKIKLIYCCRYMAHQLCSVPLRYETVFRCLLQILSTSGDIMLFL